jgi:hypothetical protein
MSGPGLLLSIAKDALSAQQYGINVTAQNIANIDTPGYTKQTPVFKAKTPAPYGGVILGRGVTIDEIIQHRDSYLEGRLRDQKSILSGLKEEEACTTVLEHNLLISGMYGTTYPIILPVNWKGPWFMKPAPCWRIILGVLTKVY